MKILTSGVTLTITLSVLLIFAGCSSQRPFEELLSPPRLNEQQAEIYEALQSSRAADGAAGTSDGYTAQGFTLKYPKSGEFRSAFVIHPLSTPPSDYTAENSDAESKEALVFYKTSGETEQLWFSILSRDGSTHKWRCTHDISIPGVDIEQVLFTDLSDGQTNIVIVYGIQGQTDRGIEIYTYDGTDARQVWGGTFANYAILDADGTPGNELVLIKQDKNGTGVKSYALVYGRNSPDYTVPKDFKLRYASVISPEILTVNSITRAEIFTGVWNLPANSSYTPPPALLIDYTKAENVYGTDVLYCYDGTLVSAIYSVTTKTPEIVYPDGGIAKGAENDGDTDGDITESLPQELIGTVREQTQKSTELSTLTERRVNIYGANLPSADYDGDGIAEITGTTPLPGYESYTADRIRSVVYYNFGGSPEKPDLTRKFTSYVPADSAYSFKLPARWEGLVTAKAENSDSGGKMFPLVTFYRFGGSVESSTQPLLSIAVISRRQYIDGGAPPAGFDYYGENSGNVILIHPEDGDDPLLLTKEEINDGLRT